MQAVGVAEDNIFKKRKDDDVRGLEDSGEVPALCVSPFRGHTSVAQQLQGDGLNDQSLFLF